MNCYDCATQDRLTRPAVAVCHDCGAAVCDHHTVARAHHLTRPAVILREEPVEPAARTLRCTTCDAAWATQHQGTPRDRLPPLSTPVQRALCTGAGPLVHPRSGAVSRRRPS